MVYKNMSMIRFLWFLMEFVNETNFLFFCSWYVGDMSRQRAENLLKHEDREGCFVIRNSSTKGMYTLSLFTKM